MYRPIDLCLSLLVIFIFKQLVHLSNTKKQKSWIICHEKINDKLALSDRAVIILETPLKKNLCATLRLKSHLFALKTGCEHNPLKKNVSKIVSTP